jgi:3',5'-cyclic-AMP phosphodiesterase
VLGNHDIWGWGIPDKSLEGQAGYGKAQALEQLGLKSPYYSFDVGAWHFVVLDSLLRRGNGYYGAIDPVQWKWLAADLAAVAKQRHICVVSHLPVLAACVFFDGDRIRPDHWEVPDAWMHRDAAALLELFRAHPVRLLISGHIHLHDVVEYDGMKFVCDGAVCGNWWKGPYHETVEGFGVFDLYADGRAEHAYRGFGWKA